MILISFTLAVRRQIIVVIRSIHKKNNEKSILEFSLFNCQRTYLSKSSKTIVIFVDICFSSFGARFRIDDRIRNESNDESL